MAAHSIYFFIFNIFYILIPGLLLLKKTKLALKDNSGCNRILISYFLGFGVLIAEYFVCSLLKMFWAFAIFSPTVILVYCFADRKSILQDGKSLLKEIDVNKTLSYVAVLIICYILSFIYTTLQVGNLIGKTYVNVGGDYFNHIGLIASLSKGLPASDLKVSGVTLYYHYFQDLLMGMCENIFHIPAFDLVTNCTPVMIGCVFGTSLFCILKKDTGKSRYSLKESMLSILRCCFFFVFCGAWGFPLTGEGYQEGFLNWNNYHILTSVNACGFAIAAIIAILIFIKNIDLDKFSIPGYIVFAVLVFSATGAKGPYAAVIVAAMVGVYFIRLLIERKLNKSMFIYVAIAAFSFLLTYLFIICGTSQYGQSKTTEMGFIWNGTLNRTMVVFIPHIGNLLKIILVLLIAFGPLIIYSLFVAVDEIKSIAIAHAVKDIFNCTAIGMIIVGAIGFIFVDQSGYSQVYFLFVAIVPLVYLSIEYTENLAPGKKWRSVLILVLIALLGFHPVISDLNIQLKAGYAAHGWFGYKESLGPSLENVSAGEVNGLKWLYENSPSDAVVLTDRRSNSENDQYTDDCRFFAYSAISERQMYIEGFSYTSISQDEVRRKIDITNQIYASSQKELDKLLDENGIDYVIVTKRMGTTFFPDSDHVQQCFDNEDISIFRVID